MSIKREKIKDPKISFKGDPNIRDPNMVARDPNMVARDPIVRDSIARDPIARDPNPVSKVSPSSKKQPIIYNNQ